MKKFIAAAGIGAALAIVPLAVAGAANASTGSFLNVLNAHDWTDGNYRGSLLDDGYDVCRFLAQGYSYSAVVEDVYYQTNVNTSWSDARWFVNTAQNHLCR